MSILDLLKQRKQARMSDKTVRSETYLFNPIRISLGEVVKIREIVDENSSQHLMHGDNGRVKKKK